jgi:ABC-type nickel/cobalt efflux system permease component RcnA
VHSHLPPGGDGTPITWGSLLALGISGGMIPCPSALIVMLSAISLQRVGFGLLLILAFSIGLAGVLTGIGLLFVYGGRWLTRLGRGGRLVPGLRLVPVASALFVTTAGIVITAQAMLAAGVIR